MFEVSFSQDSRLNSSFFLGSSLLRLVQWFVEACIGWDLCWVLVCLFVCFSSDGQGWVRWWFCLPMIGFAFLFCLLFRWGILHRVLLVVGLCLVLYSSGFLCVSSHYLIPLRVSSGEGNGNPLQCSCLENPRDGGAWWAAVYGVAQSRTRLKRLRSSSSNRVSSLVV